MKIKELMEILADLNPEHEVVLSRDGEGNGFSPLSAYGVGQYVPESTWSGELRSAENKECKKKDLNAIVLWPAN